MKKNYDVEQSETNTLSFKEKSTISGPVSEISTGKIINFCETFIDEMISQYIKLLGLPQNFDTDLLYDAIISCHPSGGVSGCVCPEPSCIADELECNVNINNAINDIEAELGFDLDINQEQAIDDLLSSDCCGSNSIEECTLNTAQLIIDFPELIFNINPNAVEQTNAGFVFNGNNINRLCQNLFNLQTSTNQDGGYVETGIGGLNFSFNNPNGPDINYSSNYLYLFMELDCNDPNTNYAQAFSNVLQGAFNDIQTQINNGTTTQANIDDQFATALKQNLWQFFRTCVPTNLGDAQSSTLAYLKENTNGLGSHIDYTPINQQNIDTLCP